MKCCMFFLMHLFQNIVQKTYICCYNMGFYQSDLYTDRSGLDASTRMSPSQKVRTSSMSRTNSSPGNFDSTVDRPMRVAEIYIASEHALKQTISNTELLKSLSSLEEFEVSSQLQRQS